MTQSKSKILKIQILLFLIFTMLATFTVCNICQINALETNCIKVVGKNEIKVTPDTAIVCLGVSTTNSSSEVASKENLEIMQKVIDSLKDFNINENSIITKDFYIQERQPNRNSTFSGYQVYNTVEFTTNELDELSEIIKTASENGANVFNGITFKLSDFSEAYNQALNNAIMDAQTKLEQLNLNLEDYKITEIVEEYCYNSLNSYYNADLLRSTNSKEFNVGEISINAQVRVTFESIATENEQ